MKSVCIVGAMNIKHMSLISLYTKYFDDNSIPYDLIFMDRYGIDEKSTARNKYCLHVKMDRNWNKFKKLLVYIRFRQYAKSIIAKNKYDIVITWQTFTAYLLADILLTKYKGRYVVNVRDYIVENISAVKYLLRKLVEKSALTTISSEGFFEFLPEGKYTRVNSINEEVLDINRNQYLHQEDGKIKIGFVGNCRYFNENRRLIEALKNDNRFEIWYCGTNSDIFKRYAQENNINNLYTLPQFDPKQTTEIMGRFDMVNSLFGDSDIDNRTLMPIRLYTSIEMEIPLIVSAGTQLSKEVCTNKLGYSVESFENLGNLLYDYLKNLNREEFSKNCSSYMIKSREENILFTDKLEKILQ